MAAPASAQQQVASGEVTTLAVVNLGLTRAEARNVQRWLAKHWNYNDAIDGYLGTNSWKAFQRCLAKYWGYDDAIDGIVGSNTIKAVQRLLKANGMYDGAIDGIMRQRDQGRVQGMGQLAHGLTDRPFPLAVGLLSSRMEALLRALHGNRGTADWQIPSWGSKTPPDRISAVRGV